jgi:plasmid stability protein
MANLTLTIDPDLLRKARVRALEQGTSVNAVVRDYLAAYAGASEANRALAAFLNVAAQSRAASGSGGRSWTRDELYGRSNVR